MQERGYLRRTPAPATLTRRLPAPRLTGRGGRRHRRPDAHPLRSPALRGDFSDFSRAMDLIGWHSMIGALPAQLPVAREGPGERAVHAAAMACSLSGVTAEPFDWELRPLFLLFNEGAAERADAYRELTRLIAGG